MINDLKRLVLKYFDIDVDITEEVRSIEDNVIIYHVKVPDNYRIFSTSIGNLCSEYLGKFEPEGIFVCSMR